MGQTTNYNLPILAESEIATKLGKDWILSINGTDAGSGFNKIDAAIKAAEQKADGLQENIGKPNGSASLDAQGKVPASQLPSMDYIPNAQKGTAGGVATLTQEGLVPVSQLPSEVKEQRVVNTIADRDAISDKFSGLSVYVKDASADASVTSGGANYIYDGTSWYKTGESESMDVVLDWENIQNKPANLGNMMTSVYDPQNKAQDVFAYADDVATQASIPVASTTGNGSAYVIDVESITELKDGLQVVIIPHVTSNSMTPTLQINLLQPKGIRRARSTGSGLYTEGGIYGWLEQGRPLLLIYNASVEYWIVQNLTKTDASDLNGKVPINKGGTNATTASDALTNLGGVPLAGGTMTGGLTLSGAPTNDLHAATKKYVDDSIAAIPDPDLTSKVSKSGDTMTGALTLSGAPTADLHAATKKYVDEAVASSDKLTWTSLTLPSSAGWYSVTYGNGRFVATPSESNKTAYSTNGTTWIESDLPSSGKWRSVTYGNGKFVTVSYSSNKAAYSTDGITWIETTLPYSTDWQSVTYGNGKFVAVVAGSSNAAYSTDGINWTATRLPSLLFWRSVTYGNGKFVAVAQSSNQAAYSTDGITWTSATLPSSVSWTSVTYGNGKFVAVASSSITAAYSTDGITWTQTRLPSSNYWNGLTYGNGKFVAVANSTNTAAYSTDGINWTATTLPSSALWRSVIYGNGKFVAVANDSSEAAYSLATSITFADLDDGLASKQDALEFEAHLASTDPHAAAGYLKISDAELSGSVTVDADTLQGHAASEFALKSYVDSAITGAIEGSY